MHIHTLTHTHTHAHTHIHIHTHTHTTHAIIQGHTQTHTYTQSHTNTYTYKVLLFFVLILSFFLSLSVFLSVTHINTHTHTHVHACTHTRIYLHLHTLKHTMHTTCKNIADMSSVLLSASRPNLMRSPRFSLNSGFLAASHMRRCCVGFSVWGVDLLRQHGESIGKVPKYSSAAHHRTDWSKLHDPDPHQECIVRSC